MSTSAVHGLIKFGKYANLERLQQNGEVYLNTWGYFKGFEANAVQGDPDEGLMAMHQAAHGAQLFVQVAGEMQPIKGLHGQIKIGVGQLENHNLLCLFALTDESLAHLSDKRVLEFGDTALVITKGDVFLARLRQHL